MRFFVGDLHKGSTLLAGSHSDHYRTTAVQLLFNDLAEGWQDDQPHSHSASEEFFIVLEGRVVVDVDGEQVVVGPRQYCAFAKGVRHGIVDVRAPAVTLMVRAPSVEDKTVD